MFAQYQAERTERREKGVKQGVEAGENQQTGEGSKTKGMHYDRTEDGKKRSKRWGSRWEEEGKYRVRA